MNETIDEFYEKHYVMAYINRYSNVIRIKNESVAEHSFFVALLVIKLADEYNFDIPTALGYALVHDILESETGDVTHYTKTKYPSISTAVSQSEYRALKDMPSSWAKVYYEFGAAHPDSTEVKIVKLADVIQCSQYASHEIKLGNKGYMETVYDESCRRRKELEAQLSNKRRYHTSK